MTDSASFNTDTSRAKTHVLSPVFEDVRPIATILPNEPIEESQSTDESPPTHQGKDLEEDHPFSGSDNVNQQSHGNEDSASEKDAMEEISQPNKPISQGTSTPDVKTIPETISTPAPAKPTPSELEQLKQTDPLGFLKAIMNVQTPSSSDLNVSPVATADSSDKEDIPSLLRQIKERFFGINLVDVLNRDPVKSHYLNQLLKKVDLLQVSPEVSETIVLLGSLLEQLQANILRKQNVEKELSETVASHDSSWNSAVEATKQGEALRLKHSENQKAIDDYENKINSWKQEIKALESKIKEAESSQAALKKFNQQDLLEVVQSGIKHFETAQKLVPEIEKLKKQRALIELRMSSWETQYLKIKKDLPKDFS